MCATPCSTPGRATNIDGRNDPSIFPTAPIYHYLSPNIKVDAPTPAGYQTPTTAIDFFTFVHVLQDGSGGVATNVPPPTVHNRVYVEVFWRVLLAERRPLKATKAVGITGIARKRT